MKNITVIGSGTMGNGIAHTFAQHGFNVALVDINAEVLNKRRAVDAFDLMIEDVMEVSSLQHQLLSQHILIDAVVEGA